MVGIFWGIKDADRALVATTLFSLLTSIFAFLAYRYTKERFRLDLFEKRYPLYQAVVTYCSAVTAVGSLTSQNPEDRDTIKQAIEAAQNSFQGIGFHKARALFGEDIHELFDKLHKTDVWLQVYGRGPGQMPHSEWAQKMADESTFIWETINRLPQTFRTYMYFGDYKRDWV